MLIINQGNTEIMNFDNIMNISVCGNDEDGYSISALGFIIGQDDNYKELGVYRTEKRAKEVLEAIYVSYANWKMINIPKANICQVISENELFGIICFKMPEK